MSTVKLSDGRKLNFNGLPSQSDIDGAVAQLDGGATGTLTSQNPVGLPGAERVRRLQESRTPAVDILKEELRTPTRAGLIALVGKGATTAVKALAVPFEAIQAGGEKAIEKLQERDISEATKPSAILGTGIPPIAAFNLAKEIGPAVLEGVKGAIKGGDGVPQFGDAIRRLSANKTFANETAANIFGVAATFAVTDPALFGALSKSVRSLGLIRDAAFTKQVLKPGVFEKIIPVAQKWVNASDEIVSTIGKKIGSTFKQTMGKRRISQKNVNEVIDSIPESVRSQLLDKGKELFGISIKKIKSVTKLVDDPITGSIKKVVVPSKRIVDNTAENLWKIRQFLDDIPTSKDFVTGASNKTRELVLNSGNKARSLLSKAVPEVQDIMTKYSKIIRRRNFIRNKLIEPSTGFVKEGAKNVLRQFQTKSVLREMADIVPETAELVKVIAGSGIQAGIKKAIGQGVKTAATVGLIRSAFRGSGSGDGGGSPMEAK